MTTVRGLHAMVASADQLATQAGMTALALGGNAVDAALATSAAIAVCGPHLNGLGGDLLTLIHHGGEVHALLAVGRAGSGADAEALRTDGHREMPLRHDIRSVTVPGYVDGWMAVHRRFATLPADVLLAPAIDLAEHGFPASPLLVGSLARVDDAARANLGELARQATATGAPVRRPGAAAALRSIATEGRDGFYGGAFGEGLLRLGDGWFTADDLADPLAEWVTPLRAEAWGVELWTTPPSSQGYLAISAAALADGLDLPDDPDDDRWAHLLIEACTAVGFDRVERLHDGADGAALVRECAARRALVDPERASTRWAPAAPGGTTYLCTADESCAVSMIQSNASGFGSWLVEPNTQINLHDRGLGFHLGAGHPAEVGPRRRPPHTLLPAMATRGGRLDTVFGSMGGDAQPQIVAAARGPPVPQRAVAEHGGERRSLGAARTGHRVRHVDRARRPDGLDRGSRRTGLGRRARSPRPPGASRPGLRQRVRARSRDPSRRVRRARRRRRSTRRRRRCCGSMN